MTGKDILSLGLIMALAMCVVAFLSYHLALAGHPGAYWLWHKVLGVM
jgi:hypothetical protein